jgi:hypothetical protein
VDYCFRLRFNLADAGYLPFDEAERTLSTSSGPTVVMVPMRSASLREADRVVVRGSGYGSEADAVAAGEAWRSTLERAFAGIGVGADFGDRTPGGSFTRTALNIAEQASGQRFLNEVHGLMTYPCDPEPRFVGVSGAKGMSVPRPETVERALELAASREMLPSEASLAFDLYSRSFFVAESADSRFLMLMMAVETMINQKSRPDHIRQHAETLIALTRSNAALSQSEANSIVGSLRWLFVESVNAAGKSLAGKLGDRTYNGMPPAAFFAECYSVRSQLVHGHVPRPPVQDVSILAAHLVHFVGHLIAGPAITAELYPTGAA